MSNKKKNFFSLGIQSHLIEKQVLILQLSSFEIISS